MDFMTRALLQTKPVFINRNNKQIWCPNVINIVLNTYFINSSSLVWSSDISECVPAANWFSELRYTEFKGFLGLKPLATTRMLV